MHLDSTASYECVTRAFDEWVTDYPPDLRDREYSITALIMAGLSALNTGVKRVGALQSVWFDISH